MAVVIVEQIMTMGNQFAGNYSFINRAKIDALLILQNSTDVVSTCNCKAGKNYKVRYRSVRGSSYSEWTSFSNDFVTIPAGTEGIYSLYMMSSTSVNVSWYDDSTAESYEVQYTAQRELFDTETNSGIYTVSVGGEKRQNP